MKPQVLTNELVLQMSNYRKESGSDRMIVEKKNDSSL